MTLQTVQAEAKTVVERRLACDRMPPDTVFDLTCLAGMNGEHAH
ncbi:MULTISPECIES: hypothetical protein [unclassified Pseudoclavibacter]|nr:MULTISPECIES: hypothetical protein [unclassified Pseudoclavibacter]